MNKKEERIYFSFFMENNFFNNDYKDAISKQINFEKKLSPNLTNEFNEVLESIRNFYINQSKDMISHAIKKINKK